MPEHLTEGIAANYDAEGWLAGIEILEALKRFRVPSALSACHGGISDGVPVVIL